MRALIFSTDGMFAAPLVLAALDPASWEVTEAADEIELLAIAGSGDVDVIAVQTTLPPVPMLALARRR